METIKSQFNWPLNSRVENAPPTQSIREPSIKSSSLTSKMVFQHPSNKLSSSKVCLQNKFTIQSKFSFSLGIKIERAVGERVNVELCRARRTLVRIEYFISWCFVASLNTEHLMFLPMKPAVFLSATAGWRETWRLGLLRLIKLMCGCQGHVLKLLASQTASNVGKETGNIFGKLRHV